VRLTLVRTLIFVVCALAVVQPVHAERGHQAYADMVLREKMRERSFAQLCRPVGTPLLAIEHKLAGLLVWRIALYTTGAWTAMTWDGFATGACVKGRIMSQLRANLYALRWQTDRAAPTNCTLPDALSPVETHYVTSGRLRFVDRACRSRLRTADHDRLVETEAILLALIRRGS